MRCPKCGHSEDRVVETRSVKEGGGVRRRRECLDCQHRFTTYEYVEAASFEVVKKDGRREPYQRAKVTTGVVKACEKRPIPRGSIDDLVERMEHSLAQIGDSEIASEEIGKRVMESLRGLDPVAYVRFASVYRNFSDIRQFLETVESLPEGKDLVGEDSKQRP